MSERIVGQRRLNPNRIKSGDFVLISIAPSYYTYARKLEGLSSFGFYDYLTTGPLTDVTSVAQEPVLLTAPLLMPEAAKWPIVGFLPLEESWPKHLPAWKTEPQALFEEHSQQLVFQPDTEYFRVEYKNNEPAYIPADPESLRGLTRQTLYTPEIVEEKLRIHYGVSASGQRTEPINLKAQPLW